MSPAPFDLLFNPRGVVVAGASTHPGKFGFVALHNVLAGGFGGPVFATNPERPTILGLETVASMDEVPAGAADLVVVCTPPRACAGILRSAAGRGIGAAFITSGGFREAGAEGARAEEELVDLARSLNMVVAGPNGQGLISTPAGLAAQIVAPVPPPGPVAVASQSGNLVSAFMNYATHSKVGISRAVSAGNAAMVEVVDYLGWFADDPWTGAMAAYVEGVGDGRRFATAIRKAAEAKPVVLVKGGTTPRGAQAAAGHTGALATDDRIFDGMVRQSGAVRATTVEEAFDAVAAFATQPLPAGPRTLVLSSAGGWGVIAADAVSGSGLELIPLPKDLEAAIDRLVPPRWSRHNPIDLAGGESRDTIPEAIHLVAEHPEVDAVVYLGMGIQANTASHMRSGPFFDSAELARICEYHERQDSRFAQAAADASIRTGKPILTATELSITQPGNSGPATVAAGNRYCFPSADRAVRALHHLWWYARWRKRHLG
ncbi:acetate--CoA ligase family protein [Candidatus Poriferisocius sp.]|uniref:acetate--CoA ligase family protein n=1 Tax=Candidatus Poriferisocius sp. TaxID=3101276 RepID=UPI003B026388